MWSSVSAGHCAPAPPRGVARVELTAVAGVCHHVAAAEDADRDAIALRELPEQPLARPLAGGVAVARHRREPGPSLPDGAGCLGLAQRGVAIQPFRETHRRQ